MTGDIDKLFLLSLDLICIAGTDGYFKKINPAFTKVLGYTERELLETPFIRFIHPDDRESTMKEVETQLRGSPTLYFENRYLHKDGSIRWLAWNAHAAAEEGLLYAIARDITSQKQKEESFSFELRELRDLVESNSDIFYKYNLEGKLVKWNRAMEKLTGLPPQELLFKPALQCIYEEDWPLVAQNIKELFEKGQSTVEARFKRADGAFVPYLFNGYLIKDADGTITGFAGTGRDISDRLKAEQEVKEQLNFIEQLVNTIPIPVFYKDSQGRYLGCNKAFEHYLGKPRGEIAGKTVYEIAPKELADIYYAADKALFDNPGVQTYETQVQSSSGERRDVQFNKAVFNKADGRCGGLIGVITDVTAFKRTEAALRESEGRFRTLVETADDVIFLSDMDFNILYENEASWISLGYTKEEWKKSESLWERVHPEDITLMMENKVTLLSKGSVSTKYRVRNKDGHYITRLAKLKVVNTDGKPTAIIAILRDITDIEQAQTALRKNELLMTTAQQMAHIGGWEYDVKKQSMTWTDEVYRIHDIAREDFARGSAGHIERSVECYDPADRPVILAAFHKCAKEGVPYDMEFPFTSAKGHRMWIRTAGYPVFGKGRNVGITGVVGHIMDITERKEAEYVFKAIVEGTSSVIGERFFRSLVQHLAQAMYVKFAFIAEMDDETTARTIAFWANGKLGDNFSYDIRHTPCENVVGKELCVYPENAAGLFPKDVWLKDHGIKSYMAIPLHNAAGKCFGHMGIMDDKPIFDASRHIDVMNIFAVRAANELERKASEEELEAAKEAAVAATLLKDKFVSLVAHDLRSPLATISMMLNVALANIKTAKYQESGEMIGKVNIMCETMMEMTVNLLDAAKLQSGDIRLTKRMCGIKNICDAVMGDLSHLAEKKGITLNNKVPGNARWYLDKILFQRVVHNLVVNAIKFSENGGVITTFLRDEQNKILAVEDTGTGIHESLLPDLFKYEIKTTTTGTSGERGTGFGLPMSMDIIKAHGGTIWAASEVGKGSVFFIELPDVKPSVLVADDDEDAVNILRAFLQNMGAEVLTAKNGAEAMEIIHGKKPILVIADLAMPVIDGLALLQNLKNNKKYSHIPVIIITGNRSVGIRQTAFECHADDFITKPLSEPDFIPRIGRFISA